MVVERYLRTVNISSLSLSIMSWSWSSWKDPNFCGLIPIPRQPVNVPPVPLLWLVAPCNAGYKVAVNVRVVPFLDVVGEHLGLLGGPAEDSIPDVVDVSCGHRLATVSGVSFKRAYCRLCVGIELSPPSPFLVA